MKYASVVRKSFHWNIFHSARKAFVVERPKKAVWADSKQPHCARHKKVSNLIFNFVSSSTDSLQGYHEKRLLNHLLNNYNLLERPVANESDPLEVRFGLTLQQIIDVVSMLWHLDLKFLFSERGDWGCLTRKGVRAWKFQNFNQLGRLVFDKTHQFKLIQVSLNLSTALLPN